MMIGTLCNNVDNNMTNVDWHLAPVFLQNFNTTCMAPCRIFDKLWIVKIIIMPFQVLDYFLYKQINYLKKYKCLGNPTQAMILPSLRKVSPT